MKESTNVIDLAPYLPALPTPAKTAPTVWQALPALVESLVTVGIGCCLVLGVVVSIVIAL